MKKMIFKHKSMKLITFENLEPFTSADQLFVSGSGMGYDYASINRSIGARHEESLYLTIEGYRESSRVLMKDLLMNHNNSWLKIDSQIYPFMFVFRHYLEIVMKDTIRYQKLIHREVNDDEVGFVKGHTLTDIWMFLKPYIKDFCEIMSLQVVEKLLHEFDYIDGGSYSFRYPFKIANRQNDKVTYSLPEMTIDLYNFHNIMEKLIRFFDGVNLKSAADLDNR